MLANFDLRSTLQLNELLCKVRLFLPKVYFPGWVGGAKSRIRQI